jgi:hypothetical protein
MLPTNPVGALTQPRAFGAFVGGRYGDFEREVAPAPPTRITQVRAFGAFTGARYGSFAGRTATQPPVVVHPVRGGGRVNFARPIQRNDQDDVLLLIAAQIAIGMLE